MKYQVIRLRPFLLCAALLVALLSLSLLGRQMVLQASGNLSKPVRPVIVVDAGHGGEDGGTQSALGVLEKDVNLRSAEKLRDVLTARGFRVVMTREHDALSYDADCKTMREKKVSDIKRRMAVMEANDGCIFLSIHQNYFSDTRCAGTQVFYSPNNDESAVLADEIQAAVKASLQPDNKRVTKPSGKEIYLLFHANRVAVMVECGFLSNASEAEKLTDDAYQTAMAAAIADGLQTFLDNRM